MDLAAETIMPRVFGKAAVESAHGCARRFKRTFLLMLFTAAATAFAEGVALTVLVVTRGRIGGVALVALMVAICLWWFCRYARRRFSAAERECLYWAPAVSAEWEFEAELRRLSDDFFVFHNLNAAPGAFEHVIVGPTGIFAIETKNWVGVAAADTAGELTLNRERLEQAYIKKLGRRTMLLRTHIRALMQSHDFYVRGLMVFPSAHVDAPYGSTQEIHCIRLEHLHDYVQHPVYSRKLAPEQVDQLARVLAQTARSDADLAGIQPGTLRPALI